MSAPAPLPSEERGKWIGLIHLDDWALPLRFRCFTDPWGWYLSLQILCLTISYERWAQ